MPMSAYLRTALIDGSLRATDYTAPATVYVALFSENPTDAGTGAELSGGDYARESIAFDADTDGVTQNTADVTFNTATADWATATHFGIFDADTAGNLLFYGELATYKTCQTGSTIIIKAGQLTVTFT